MAMFSPFHDIGFDSLFPSLCVEETSILLHFWDKDAQISYTPDSSVVLRKGKSCLASEIIVGDIVKNAHGQWDKVTSITTKT